MLEFTSDNDHDKQVKFPPYVRLWAAVIRRAAVDNRLYDGSDNARSEKIGEDARAWLYGKYDIGLFNSFDSVCEIVGLTPTMVLASAERLTEETARRQRGMEFGD